MSKQSDISIVIPFLNEAENVELLSDKLCGFVRDNPGISFEIILVNDGSTDSSVQKIMKYGFPVGTKLVSLSRNFGSHAALRAGVLHAKSDWITFIYADLQDPLENILTMYEKTPGNDIIWGYRKDSPHSFFERTFSGMYAGLMRRYVSRNYHTNGFDVVLFSRKVAERLNGNIENNSSVFLQILTMGFRQDYMEYTKSRRQHGKSKWSVSKKVKLLIDSFVAFSYAPIRMVSLMGILFCMFGICWTAYVIARKLIYNDLESGWPALVAILMIGFGITNISLGIIAEYLWRILDASRNRPVFIIDEVVEVKQRS